MEEQVAEGDKSSPLTARGESHVNGAVIGIGQQRGLTDRRRLID
jgi:hypothetical protein